MEPGGNNRRITERQLNYIWTLADRHRITRPALDAYVQDRFHGAALDVLTIDSASALIQDMESWHTAPAAIQRAMGQLDLFGGDE